MDEYETRYQTKLDTISKMTALKIFISHKVAEETSSLVPSSRRTRWDSNNCANSSTNASLTRSPRTDQRPMEINAIMRNIEELSGEAQPRAESTDLEESIASLVRSRENSVSDADSDGRNRDRKKTTTSGHCVPQIRREM